MIITTHAIIRFQERVANVPEADVRKAMDTRAVRTAIAIGAPYVKLSGGQRIVIENGTIITVLPADAHPTGLSTAWNERRA